LAELPVRSDSPWRNYQSRDPAWSLLGSPRAVGRCSVCRNPWPHRRPQGRVRNTIPSFQGFVLESPDLVPVVVISGVAPHRLISIGFLVIMSSDSRKRQLRLYNEILRSNTIAEIACDWCFINNLTCHIMPNSNLKCAECTKKGRPCVNMSWESLDKTRDDYQARVDADEKLLAEVMGRLLRNKAILKQAEDRARRKALCLASEMEVDGEEVNASKIDCPAASIGMEFSPLMWSTLGALDESVASHGAAQASVGNS
jgi:hypothetical protein